MRFVLVGLLCAGTGLAFKAAVYEHVQRGDHDWEQRVAATLEIYRNATKNASLELADIIVFPEDGILFDLKDREEVNKWAEDIPEPGVLPCLKENVTTPLLANLSCMAQESHIYLVANIIDKKPCNTSDHGCPRDKIKYFNTNVAFDRNGTLVSRYHKNHLFVEPFMSPADPFEFAVFETDFGVRVGMFICFDVLFNESSRLVQEHNVTLAVMSTWWFDQLPMLYSVAVQQAWSLHNGIPLLAAGIQKPDRGSLGSGIFAGKRGPLNYTYSPDWQAKLLMADLTAETPRNPRYHGDVVEPRNRTLRYLDVSDHAAQELSASSGLSRVCLGDFCCTLSYEAPALHDKFVLLAKHGVERMANLLDAGIEQCILAVCESTNRTLCTSFPTKSSTKFTRLQLTGEFSTPAIFPIVASNELALTAKDKWQFETTAPNVGHLTLNQERGHGEEEHEAILQVALYARLYKLDRFLH